MIFRFATLSIKRVTSGCFFRQQSLMKIFRLTLEAAFAWGL